MDLSQFSGLIILFLAIVFSIVRNYLEMRDRRQNPEKYAKERKAQDEAYKEFLRSLDINVDEVEEKPVPKPPPPVPPKKKEFKPPKPVYRVAQQGEEAFSERFGLEPTLDSYSRYESIEERSLETNVSKDSDLHSPLESDVVYGRVRRPSEAKSLLSNLPRPQDMVVLHEIFGEPRSISPYDR